jgi:ligand-binding sensor domain-containing protein/serine phosphatase RsbU (regulator of sigma subunit)
VIKNIVIFFLFGLVFSCSNKEEKGSKSIFQPTVIHVVPKIVNKDSIAAPIVIKGPLQNKEPVGKPVLVSVLTNSMVFQEPSMSQAPTKFKEVKPGTDTFLLPKIINAVPKVITAGMPQVILGKDMSSKNRNPSNFSSFNILQGLKSNTARVLYTAKNGNLWIGSLSNGVCKYDGKYFTYFTEKEGLAGNAILCIFEDSKGNLWFGTNNKGISCYDGKEFKNFTTNEGLVSNVITSIGEDADKNIWIGTTGGLVSYDGKIFSTYTKKQGLPDNAILAILLDKDKKMWLGTNNGLCIYNGKTFSLIEGHVLGNYIYSLLQTDDGVIWIGTFEGGITRYDGKTFTRYAEANGLSNSTIWCLAKDKNGNVWAGTDNGATKFNGKVFSRFREKDGLSNNVVWSIATDNNGEVWFGTNDGLNRYDGETFTHYTEFEGLSKNTIAGLALSKTGKLWIATNGGGICYYDSLKFYHFGPSQGYPDPICWGFYMDSKENLWMGTRGGGTKRYRNDTVQPYGGGGSFIYCHFEDKLKNMWFGSLGEGVTMFNGKEYIRYTTQQGLSDNTVNTIYQDKFDNMWIGTRGGGVTKFVGNKVIHLTEKEGLSNNIVNCFYEDRNGNIWIGTNSGLNIYNGSRIYQFTEKQGLAGNFVTNFLADKNGNLWIGTANGISKINVTHLNTFFKTNLFNNDKPLFKNFNYADGFLGINCIKNSLVEDKNGFIWWGTNDRLTRYNPNGDVADTVAPQMNITSIKLFNEAIAWKNVEGGKDTTLANGSVLENIYFDSLSRWYNIPENLSLPYDNNYVTFNFIGLHLKNSNAIVYQYKLDGLEKKWSSFTKSTEIPYTNLLPGKYTFMVKAMNNEGYWSTPFSYTFKIRPPWWQTWWFRLIILGAIVLIVRYYIKWREKTLKQRQKLLEKAVDERTAEVTEKKLLIEEKQKEIIDSINYARRIQYTLLAHELVLKKHFNEHFVLFKPKDIVSGDFYWATSVVTSSMFQVSNSENNNMKQETLNKELFFLAVCDSTGHGVPGAFMSLLNISFLNEAINERSIYKPNEIFNYVRERLTNSISKEGNKDGFDGVLICIETFLTGKEKTINITYAASNNAPVIIKNGLLTELEADRMPVGVGERKEDFKLYELDFEKGDMLYLFTDGYADQFGGPKGKKFKYKKLNETFAQINSKDLKQQLNILNAEMESWKGSLEQVDDILIIGIKL